MNEINYLNAIQETLIEQWNKYVQPLQINHEDLIAGMKLLTKIAVETINKKSSKKEIESIDKSVSLDTESLNESVDKIKVFVEDKARSFRRVCQTGFPFSLLDNTSTEIALRDALEHDDSILSRFIMLDGNWISEKELEQKFGEPFKRLQTREIVEVCSDFKQAYVKNGDNKSGYYLLWLIKQATGCNYKIPEKEDFNHMTVAKVLNQFFAESGSLINAPNFIEILHYRVSRINKPLYQEFLDSKSYLIFLNFAVGQLQSISMDKWPSKADIIIDLLETVTVESKLAIAKALASSKDHITSEVGKHLLAALIARSFRETIPHFNSLVELLPNFNHTNAEIIFGHPFIEFCHDRSFNQKNPDSEFKRELHFNGMRKVFIQDSLMIGVYKASRMLPYLLAYDMNTEKLVWGIPLTPISLEDLSLNKNATSMAFGKSRNESIEYTLKKVGENLCLQFIGEKKVYFIDSKTGEFNFTLELPEVFKDTHDSLHISPKGFAYQILNQDQILIGGEIVDKKWKTSFIYKNVSGELCPFSTHYGFQQDFEDKLVLFGPTGDQVTIQNCITAKAQDDKLYLIEKDPIHKDKCLLTIRTLKINKEVVSNIEKSISLNVKDAYFGELCQNGQLVLFSDDFSNISTIFVDLNSQKVIYSQHKFPSSYGEHFINTESGEIWTWDEFSKKIWKVSSENITLMGSMACSRGTTLLHADKLDRLYFIDRPF